MPENAKSDGYKFAVTFLVAITSILYAIFNYLQNVAIDNAFWYIIYSFIPIGIIIAVGFLVYILLKGFTKEVTDENHIENLNEFAKKIYQLNIVLFLFFINYLLSFVISSIICIIFNLPLLIDLEVLGIPLFFILLLLCIYIYYSLIVPKNSFWDVCLDLLALRKNHLVFIPVFAVWLFLLIFIPLYSPFSGHVILEMKNINYKSDTEIPVTIQVTGPDPGIKLVLIKDESGNPYELANISLIRSNLLDSNKERFIYNDYFIANSRDIGKYKVFINSTNMTTGYYELWSTRPGYEKIVEKEGFYLVNRSSNID